jgi:TetR/AcrR family transcriptional regulator, ethionamide resistance regulator
MPIEDCVQPPARRSVRSDQRELTRSRLRAAARACFEENGYSLTSIDEIAVRTGVGRATVYLHYSGKEAIMLDLLVEDWKEQARQCEHLAGAPTPDRATLRRWVTHALKGHQKRRKSAALYALVLNNEPHSGARYAQHRDQLILTLARRFPAFAAAALSERARLAAHNILIQLDQICLLVSQGHFESFDCAVDLTTDMFGSFLNQNPPPPLSPDTVFPVHPA